MESQEEAIARVQRETRERLRGPVARMEMAQSLRYAADVLEVRILTTIGDEPKTQEAYDERQRRKRLDRPAQMLYQTSYENAVKGVLVLQRGLTESLSRSHELARLFQAAGIALDVEEAAHVANLDRMNQLGRYRFSSKEDFGTWWSSKDWILRERIDAKVVAAWTAGGGAPEHAFLAALTLLEMERLG